MSVCVCMCVCVCVCSSCALTQTLLNFCSGVSGGHCLAHSGLQRSLSACLLISYSDPQGRRVEGGGGAEGEEEEEERRGITERLMETR